MIPGGFATSVHEAAARGDIPVESVEHLLAAYAIPSLDTTVSAIGSSIWLFARHPDQWDLVRADPSLIPRAFAEAIRLESPVPWFGRTTRRAYSADGLSIEPGRRVLVSSPSVTASTAAPVRAWPSSRGSRSSRRWRGGSSGSRSSASRGSRSTT
jgi:cytochrome P450